MPLPFPFGCIQNPIAMDRLDLINQTCQQFLLDHLPAYKRQAYEAYSANFLRMPVEFTQKLSKQTDIDFTTLVMQYGFSQAVISIDEMNAAYREEGSGKELGEVIAVA